MTMPVDEPATVQDAWGDLWEVHERHGTQHGVDILLGSPRRTAPEPGRLVPVRYVVTSELKELVRRHSGRIDRLNLPIGKTARKRIRRLLGYDEVMDPAWWEARTGDLADPGLSDKAFSERHGHSPATVSAARAALLGLRRRPAGWWREPEAAALPAGDATNVETAEALGPPAGIVRSLRAVLRSRNDAPAP